MDSEYNKFDDIRPYLDEEVPGIIRELLEDADFKRVITAGFSKHDWDAFAAKMLSLKSIRDFQHEIIEPFMFPRIRHSCTDIQFNGLEKIDKRIGYTYISNHRDIVLDPAILSLMMVRHDRETVEIAIGDNLMVYPWIEKVVKLNKSFLVRRGLSVRQAFEASRLLSEYIHYVIAGKKESVWIAQREGRAKDSNDKTQISLLKMLAMGSASGFVDSIKELNICPLSLSYEYDPCDYLKAKEFQQKRDEPEYKKTKADDYLSMKTGMEGFKGLVHFQIGNPINPLLEQLPEALDKNEAAQQIAELIDSEIYRNYRFYPGNYIAYDRLWGKDQFKQRYTDEEVKSFDVYLQQQLDKIDLPNKDIPFLTERMLEMYAYPLRNYLSIS